MKFILTEEDYRTLQYQIHELQDAVESLIDFGQTVAGSSSYWEEEFPKFEHVRNFQS